MLNICENATNSQELVRANERQVKQKNVGVTYQRDKESIGERKQNIKNNLYKVDSALRPPSPAHLVVCANSCGEADERRYIDDGPA